ncbi:MAG: TIGR02996 domain-containing protein [Proteobacteria bacterium]|nr:TIGR02996 domain-containing protein [Pseudomonadota bacterium]
MLDVLRAAIFAAPDDDAPRMVYADALLERGDPRGELIVLQLRGVDPIRQAELVATHQAAWLGALAPALSEVVFERGFLARCRFDGRGWRDLLVDTPRLITHLHYVVVGEDVWVQGDDVTATPQSGGTWTIDEAQRAPLERCVALPALRELVVSGAPPGWRDGLLTSPIAGRLARLEVA